MHVLALEMQLRLPAARSLKDRRAVVRSVVDGARNRFEVAAAEVGGQDTWQSASVGFAAVSASPHVLEEVMDAVEAFVWSRPDLEVVSAERSWLDA